MKSMTRISWVVTLLASLVLSATAYAQATSSVNQIKFISFNGIYHLSRDSRGVSLLTTQETIGADFQNSVSYGIKRVLPENFNGRSVSIKVLNVTDAAGSPVPFNTSSSSGNLTITTGDPKISLYGPQTIIINYQTSGVINLSQKADQFLLDINGRGWSQPFTSVSATLYVPDSFKAAIQNQPSCYVSPGQGNCQISQQKKTDSTVITTQARNVAAGQALVLRVNFQPATFSQKSSGLSSLFYLSAIVVVLALGLSAWLVKTKKA